MDVRGEEPPAQGTLVRGRYEVVQLLGRGGFGATYLVRDKERFDTLRALKELLPSARSGPKMHELFEREARTLMALANERIPAMHAFFDEDDRFFLVQDFIQGEALDRRLERLGPLPEEEVLDIVLQVLDVLEYLHGRESPVVHRDIKPSNLIRDEQGRVYLIDFGAVREAVTGVLGGDAATVIGTAGYAPLEQIVGRPVAASDLYALGATALHLLSGRPPVDWHDVESGELRLDGRLMCSDRMRRTLTSLLADLPQRLRSAHAARVSLKSDDSVPTPTHQAATEVAERPSSRLPSPAASSLPAMAPSALPRATPRRRGRLVAWGGVGVTVLGVALWATLHSEAPSSPPRGGASTTPEKIALSGTERDARDVAPREPLPLVRVATVRTPAGLTVGVRYPDGWQVVSKRDEGHLAVRDPATNVVFLAGLDEVEGGAMSSDAFADRWARDVGRLYTPLHIRRPAKVFDDASVFRLEVGNGSQPSASGTLSITAFEHKRVRRTAFQWWASLRNDEALIPTLQAMAGALTVADSAASG